MKELSEKDIRRLVIQMLNLGILGEIFISQRVGKGLKKKNLSVYLEVGKAAPMLLQGMLKVEISHGENLIDPNADKMSPFLTEFP